MSRKFNIPHTDAQDIRNILLSDGGYSPTTIARKWQRVLAKNDSDDAVHALANYAMGWGHIELANALVDLGADPRLGHVGELWLGLNHDIYGPGRDEDQLSIPNILARQGSTQVVPASNLGQLRRSRCEVLQHLSDHPGLWNVDIHQIHQGTTALVAGLSLHSRACGYHGASLHLAEQELIEFMQALIDRGAVVNPEGDQTLLAQALPKHNPNRQPTFKLLDQVIAWGADTKAHAPHAWARAIAEDTDSRYTKNAPWGPRARALMERGIALSSPANLPSAWSPLAQAFTHTMRLALNQMIATGIDPCWQDPRTHHTLLTLAGVRSGQISNMLSMFPEGSFRSIVNLPTKNGDTALHLAVNALDEKLIKRLLREGADVHALNAKKQKPLQAMKRSRLGAHEKMDAVFDILMQHGGDAGQDQRSSGLHQAASVLSAKTISRLLAAGADASHQDKKGRTAVAMVVLAHQRSINTYFDSRRGGAQTDCLHAFSEAGVDINQDVIEGKTLLHHAMERCCDMAAVALILAGADIHRPGPDGGLPMHAWNSPYYQKDRVFTLKNQAAIISVIEAFIAAGADIDLPDPKGQLPFAPARDLPGVKAAIERAILAHHTHLQTGAPSQRMRL